MFRDVGPAAGFIRVSLHCLSEEPFCFPFADTIDVKQPLLWCLWHRVLHTPRFLHGWFFHRKNNWSLGVSLKRHSRSKSFHKVAPGWVTRYIIGHAYSKWPHVVPEDANCNEVLTQEWSLRHCPDKHFFLCCCCDDAHFILWPCSTHSSYYTPKLGSSELL